MTGQNYILPFLCFCWDPHLKRADLSYTQFLAVDRLAPLRPALLKGQLCMDPSVKTLTVVLTLTAFC